MPTVIDGITGINRITGGADVGGNLDFVASSPRIMSAYFSSEPPSTRFAFQTSQPNAGTIVAAIPNGTNKDSYIRALNNSDPSNSSFISLQCNASASTIVSGSDGTGTPLPMVFVSGSAERMRIGSDGTVLIKKTSFDYQQSGVQIHGVVGDMNVTANNNTPFAVTRTGTDGVGVQFFKGTSAIGNIFFNASSVAYNTSSDYRLKENIRAMVAPLERLLRLKPVLFNWKVDGSEGEGFIAHQLQQEVPIAVSGEKDGEQMQGVDASKVVPLLVAAVQELTLKVLALEAKLSGGKQA